MLQKYVENLCDQYAHFGEFMRHEIKQAGLPVTGKTYREHITNGSLLGIYKGTKGVGPASSKAFGLALGYPEDHYMVLFKLFKKEKARRAQTN